MCILKILSDSHSFFAFAAETDIPIVSCKAKGELRNSSGDETYQSHRISLDVSDRDWDDFPGQVSDAILFLSRWEGDLINLMSSHHATEAYLDFPINSRLNDNIANQNDHLPRELIVLCGRIGLGIEMAIYSRDAFELAETEA